MIQPKLKILIAVLIKRRIGAEIHVSLNNKKSVGVKLADRYSCFFIFIKFNKIRMEVKIKSESFNFLTQK